MLTVHICWIFFFFFFFTEDIDPDNDSEQNPGPPKHGKWKLNFTFLSHPLLSFNK